MVARVGQQTLSKRLKFFDRCSRGCEVLFNNDWQVVTSRWSQKAAPGISSVLGGLGAEHVAIIGGIFITIIQHNFKTGGTRQGLPHPWETGVCYNELACVAAEMRLKMINRKYSNRPNQLLQGAARRLYFMHSASSTVHQVYVELGQYSTKQRVQAKAG